MYNKIDSLLNIDFNNRRIDKLYEANQLKLGQSPLKLATEKLTQLEENDYVFITTGSVTRSWVTPKIGETDGPLGAAALAKTLRDAFNIIPIILTEESLIESTIPVLNASGLQVVTTAQLVSAQENHHQGYTSICSILPFTDQDHLAQTQAESLLQEFNPKLLISIEKAGKNSAGIYHNMRGHDYSFGRSRVDTLFNLAFEKSIATIAIGDGGNEIGMANVKEAVEEYVPYGATCNCGCGQGIAAGSQVDILLTSCVSNWGCYALCATIASYKGKMSFLHTAEKERFMLETAILSGHVDGATGKSDLTVDGFDLKTNQAMINMINSVVLKH